MNVFLLFPNRDADPEAPLPWQAEALEQDLGLPQVYEAMAQGDKFLHAAARRVLLDSLEDVDLIRYRQAVLQDCLAHPDIVREIYRIPIEAQEKKREQWLGIFSRSPQGILSSAVDLLAMFVGLLRRLKAIADAQAGAFASEGFRRFFAMLQAELDEAYFEEVETHLRTLKFRQGVLLSAELGPGNEGTRYTLRKPRRTPRPILKQIFDRTPSCGFTIPPRDTYGSKALGEIKDRGLNEVANAVAQAADHIDGFLKLLQAELAFYVGALNLAERIAALGMPLAFPDPAPAETRRFTASGLYDLGLALAKNAAVVGNDIQANAKNLVIITGANQGGKTTFLRSVGLAQLMMQAGLFVPAQALEANLARGVFTHFKREEDAEMESGKFDEELGRMDAIADHLRAHSLVLFNESFAATNEREGSEIARQIVDALLEGRVKVFFVTHFYTFAHSYYAASQGEALFLRAERLPDGRRTFKMIPAEPLQTSFGEDLYRQIFKAG